MRCFFGTIRLTLVHSHRVAAGDGTGVPSTYANTGPMVVKGSVKGKVLLLKVLLILLLLFLI
jgi:hypothetical protein